MTAMLLTWLDNTPPHGYLLRHDVIAPLDADDLDSRAAAWMDTGGAGKDAHFQRRLAHF